MNILLQIKKERKQGYHFVHVCVVILAVKIMHACVRLCVWVFVMVISNVAI